MLRKLSVADFSAVISSISSQENPYVFRKVTASTVKQYETSKNLFCEVTQKNTRNLHACFVSPIFLCYKRVSWPFCKSSVADFT